MQSISKKLIRDTQSHLEGPPPAIQRGPIAQKPSLERIQEVTSSVEKGSEPSIIPPLDDNVLAEKSQMAETQKPLTTVDFGDEIPEMEEALVNEMWESVRKHVGETSVVNSPPLSMLDFTGQEANEVDIAYLPEDEQASDSTPSKQTLRTMPSYIGDYEDHSQVMQVPSMRKLPPKKKDMLNLQALLSAPVTCTLLLTDLLKVKPELWDEVALFMSGQESKSRSLGLKDLVNEHLNVHSKPPPIPINKVGTI